MGVGKRQQITKQNFTRLILSTGHYPQGPHQSERRSGIRRLWFKSVPFPPPHFLPNDIGKSLNFPTLRPPPPPMESCQTSSQGYCTVKGEITYVSSPKQAWAFITIHVLAIPLASSSGCPLISAQAPLSPSQRSLQDPSPHHTQCHHAALL